MCVFDTRPESVHQERSQPPMAVCGSGELHSVVDPDLLQSPYGKQLAREEIERSIALTLHLQRLSYPDGVEFGKYCEMLIDAGAATSVEDVVKLCPPHLFKPCYRKIVNPRMLVSERYLMTRGLSTGHGNCVSSNREFLHRLVKGKAALAEEDWFLCDYEFVQCHTILAPQASDDAEAARNMYIMHSFVAACDAVKLTAWNKQVKPLLTEYTHQELSSAIDEFERTIVYMADLSNGIKKVVPYHYWRLINDVAYLTVEGSNTTPAQQKQAMDAVQSELQRLRSQ